MKLKGVGNAENKTIYFHLIVFFDFFLYLLSPTCLLPGAELIAENVDCNIASEDEFKNRLEQIVKSILDDSIGDIDYKSVVSASWDKNNLNQTIDELVDAEVKRIRKVKTSYELVKTLASQEAREKLAVEVAEGVFEAEEFKSLIENVCRRCRQDCQCKA